MREILFRGRTKDGRWAEGNLWHIKCEVCGEVTTEVVKIHPIKINGADWPEIVDPETVGQFTGMTDKNGRKVFEGDLIACENILGELRIGCVVFGVASDDPSVKAKEPAFGVMWGYSNRTCRNELAFWAPRSEVIGNIHDSPELLEVDRHE